LEQAYHDQEISMHGENGENVRLFFALGIGYLLGLYQQDGISDREFSVCELQIPGLIMLHLAKIADTAV